MKISGEHKKTAFYIRFSICYFFLLFRAKTSKVDGLPEQELLCLLREIICVCDILFTSDGGQWLKKWGY